MTMIELLLLLLVIGFDALLLSGNLDAAPAYESSDEFYQ